MSDSYFGQDYKKYAKFAEYSYSFTPETARVGTAVRDERYTTDKKNGFQGCVYVDGDTVIIAYRGTDQKADIRSDNALFNKRIPEQYEDALGLYNKVVQDPKFKGKKIILTGHSLGGSLAELVSSTKMTNGVQPKAITFNSYGTTPIIQKNKNIFEENRSNDNFYISGDRFVGAARDHSGKDIVLHPDGVKFGKNHSIVSFENVTNAHFNFALRISNFSNWLQDCFV